MLIGLLAIVVIAVASLGLVQKATAVDTVPDFSIVTADPYPLTGYAGNPVLTASMVTDRNANFVADPSLFYENGVWYLFFEVSTAKYGEEIAFANSTDAVHWNYQQIVLSDSQYRFSFPEVWKVNGIYYMTADCDGLDTERIYTATNFPYGWTYASTLVSGKAFADPTVFYYNGLWWLYVSDTSDSNLYLYYSQSITGPYTQHPMSPIVSNDASKARPAGRTIVYNGAILRSAQKCDVEYGEKVRVFQVDTLTTTSYAEHEISASPLLYGSGSGWNSERMHTLNAWWNGTNWIEVADGAGTDPWGGPSQGNPWSIGIYYTTKSPLSITIAPTLAVKSIGQSQLFTSTVSGGAFPYSYQWCQNGANVSGATSPTWTFVPKSSGSYIIYLNVTDNVGSRAESNTATVTVNGPLSVTVSPTPVTMDIGQSQIFTSSASSGTPPYTYQWYLNGGAVQGATNATWTFSPTSAGSYTVYVAATDSATPSTSAQSNTAHVTVNPQPTVTISPLTSTIYLSQSQAYTSDAAGTGTSPYSYQWYLNGSLVSGATSSTWTFTPTSTGTYQISARVTDGAGEVAQSSNAQLTVKPKPPISLTISPSSTVTDTSQSVTFTSSITGGISPFTYQWYLDGSLVSSANSSTWTFTPTSTGNYQVYLNVTDNLDTEVQSNTAFVTDNPLPSASVSPSSATMDVGQSQLFTSTVSGGTGPYSYQWCLNGANVSGATSPTWSFTPNSPGSYSVYLNVTDNIGFGAEPNTTSLTVNFTPSVSVSPSSVVMTVGQPQVFASNVSGGTPPCFYQWYLNDSPVSNAVSSNWTFTPASPGSYTIYVKINDTVGMQATSNTAHVQTGIHDVAVTNAAPSKTVIGQGYGENITVAVQNQGNFTENSNVTVYANATIIASQKITLPSGNSTNITLTWNTTGFAYGNYTISAYAWPVPDETNTANNNYTDGIIVVTIPGDVNGDFTVGLKDLVILTAAYGSKPGEPKWNPNADIAGNGIIGLSDLTIMATHYGQHYP